MSRIAITGNASGTGTFTISAPNGNTDRTLTIPDVDGSVVTANASGNVGIGTTAPVGKFEVRGGRSWFTGNNELYSLAVRYGAGTGTMYIGATNSTNSSMQFSNGGGAALFNIDWDGNVTMPKQPSFYADVSSSTTFQGDVSNGIAIFNRATVNIGNHYSTATGKFTAPVAGTYVFSIGAFCSSPIAQFWFVVNGNRSESFLVAAAGAQNTILSASGMMRLEAGDSLGVLPYTGTANVTLSPSSLHTFFRGHLIG